MDDRWAFPIPLTMQRQAGSAPKPRKVKAPSVAPEIPADDHAKPQADVDAPAEPKAVVPGRG